MSKNETRTSVRVTVKMAREFLDSRVAKQRRIGARHVAELADAMLNGRWIYNGESIKIDKTGAMIDGQHRCAAGIKARKAFYTDIVYGLPEEAYKTVDQKAKSRSASDVLTINGEKSTRSLASALAWNIAYNTGKLVKTGKQWLVSPDAQQIEAELTANPKIKESVIVGRMCKGMLGGGPAAFLHYRFSLKDQPLADWFFHQFSTGENLPSNSPILLLRNWFLEDRIQNKAKLPMGEKIASVIKTWNLIRKSVKTKKRAFIKWRSGGNAPEKFPIII